MSIPRFFISSTVSDLIEIRKNLSIFLSKRGYETMISENGSIVFGNSLDLPGEKCVEAVSKTNYFILILYKKYGRPMSGHKYPTTFEELRKAISLKKKIFVFCNKATREEYYNWLGLNSKCRKGFNTKVCDIGIFNILKYIEQRKPEVPIKSFERYSEIEEWLYRQILADIGNLPELEEENKEYANIPVRINAYRFFHYFSNKKITREELSIKTGIPNNKLRQYELGNPQEPMGKVTFFAEAPLKDVARIARVLDIPIRELIGHSDDDAFISHEIESYVSQHKRQSTRQIKLKKPKAYTTKAIVFDFDGTLTSDNRKEKMSLWEKIWIALGYSISDSQKLFFLFLKKEITHKEWCNLTCEKFKAKKISIEHLNTIADEIHLIKDAFSCLETLSSKNIKLYITSGGILQIINRVLENHNCTHFFQKITANNFVFNNGVLDEIQGTKYDFIGKANFIRKIAKEQSILERDILFIGNSVNDEEAYKSGARILCMNPHYADVSSGKKWHYFIEKANSLNDILPYI